MYWYTALGSILVLAVWRDVTAARIPNLLTIPPVGAALLCAFIFEGMGSVYNHALGGALVGGVWFIFWQWGIIGGGDQKLMALVGVFLGYRLAVPAIFFVALAGGIQALIVILYRFFWVAVPLGASTVRGLRLPYAIAIASGTVVTIAYASV